MYSHVAHVRYATRQVRATRGIDMIKLRRRVLNSHDMRAATASASVTRIYAENPSAREVKPKARKNAATAVPLHGSDGDGVNAAAAPAAASAAAAAASAPDASAASASAADAKAAKAAEAAADVAAKADADKAAAEVARVARAAHEKALARSALVAAHGGPYIATDGPDKGKVDKFFAAKNPAKNSAVGGTIVSMRVGDGAREMVMAFSKHNGLISSFREVPKVPSSNGGRASRGATKYQVLVTTATNDNKVFSGTVSREKIDHPGVANEEAKDSEYIWVDVANIKDEHDLPLRIPDTFFSAETYDDAPLPLPPPAAAAAAPATAPSPQPAAAAAAAAGWRPTKIPKILPPPRASHPRGAAPAAAPPPAQTQAQWLQTVSKEHIEAMSVSELKTACESLGLSNVGLKKKLQERLVSHLKLGGAASGFPKPSSTRKA